MGSAAPTYAEFIAAFPAFGQTTLGVVQSQLSLSARLLSADAWGDFYGEGVALDAAHNLAMTAVAEAGGTQGAFQAAVGPASSVSAAGVSVSFNSAGASEQKSASVNWYAKTGYGQRFLSLRRTVVPLGVMAA